MLSGFNREQEKSVIVSALARVVAGDERGDDQEFSELMMMNQGGGDGGESATFSNVDFGSSSLSFPWGVGEKRRREDQVMTDVGLMPESSVAVCRAYNLPLVGSN